MEARGFKSPWASFIRMARLALIPRLKGTSLLKTRCNLWAQTRSCRKPPYRRLVVKPLSNQAKYSLNPHQKTHFYDSASFFSTVWVDG